MAVNPQARTRPETAALKAVETAVHQVVIGQERLVNRLLIGLLCDGHVLIEGVPGLAKTLTVRALAAALHVGFHRVQFTPDLLPSDIVGTQIYNPRSGEFSARTGPVFTNLLLADEINRAPAKVQSALLEAMEERQVTLGDETRPLPSPFMVLATQNPIEQEGTYPLPEAQLDRFLLKVVIGYPSRAEERAVMERMGSDKPEMPQPVLDADGLFRAQDAVSHGIFVDDRLKEFILSLVAATREPASSNLKALAPLIALGASPRATLALLKTSKAHAFLRGSGHVAPEDIRQVAPDVLRHRIALTFEAEAESISADQIIEQVIARVAVP
ncbi:MAG: MoxR family ATPase [Chloroflexi bacterium]|nr:MoxR family ATPase [Chloroflexota bacterium]